MVLRLAVLILAAALLCPAAWAGERQLCLSCHPVHYRELGACTGCHGGNGNSLRPNIAHSRLIEGRYARFTIPGDPDVERGGRLLESLACCRCHVTGGTGNRLATSLDSAARTRGARELADALRKPAMEMPDFRLDEQGVDAVVNAVLANAAKRKADVIRPQVVHFRESGPGRKDAFSRLCGQCHRALSYKLGAVGGGNQGPNLSGLLSPYYPKSYRGNRPWDGEALRTWLENPRKIAPVTRMRPVRVKGEELRELREILTVLPEE